MFDRIAGPYDAMNTLMTAGLHHRWRARAVELAAVRPGSRVIDVATGTGDLAIALARAVAPGGEVVACDFSEQMLARARAKAPELRFEWADALSLPYAGDTFDAATVGFGARNFSDLRRGIEEMVRVVRPGGRVVILEITRPTREPLASFYRAWFDRIVSERTSGKLGEKEFVIVTARGGGYLPGTPREGWDHSTTYLTRILGEVWGADLTLVQREFTLVGVNPALDAFAEPAAQMHAEALSAAREAGRALALL